MKKAVKKAEKATSKEKIGREKSKAEKKSLVFTVGKRKRAVARTVIKPGKGAVYINNVPLNIFGNETVRLLIQEPLLLSGDLWKGYDFYVNVKGGGVMGQAEAIRQSIARGLVEFNPNLRKTFMGYDRNLLIYDSRRTEPHKPPRSSQGPRRYKQRSKR
ncbi:MAG TPA: 30S ribosomal protein S9 [Candidatus Aenigmarchaeota archaeon]|nr:30S ribosomal protein S9 [Candidatus Aenigmarchaeota archaeon]